MKSENGKVPKQFQTNDYREMLKGLVGKRLHISILSNRKALSHVDCQLEYVSRELFGVKVLSGVSEYVTSFSFSDLFIGKIAISELEDEDK